MEKILGFRAGLKGLALSSHEDSNMRNTEQQVGVSSFNGLEKANVDDSIKTHDT